MSQQQIDDGYHLSFSIGKSLWDDLVGSALPVKIKEGTLDLGECLPRGQTTAGARKGRSASRGSGRRRRSPKPVQRPQTCGAVAESRCISSLMSWST